MLGQSTRYRIFLLLKAIAENEEIVEEQRQQLAKQHGFEPWAAFKRIDRMGLGKISAYDINQFLQENMVDYITEVECFHMFNFFDRDQDGFLDFADFLTLVLPNVDVQLRAKVSQRQNYEVGKGGRLQSNVEFELSRLLEKEIHYHVKVEIEKKELECMEEFNTVATFSMLDPLNYGYLDFENLKTFINKFKNHDMGKDELNAILRRMGDEADAKITFRQFSLGITPEMAGLSDEAANIEFNHKEKELLNSQKKTLNDASKQQLRAFRPINRREDSPVRQEFKELPLKQQADPDTSYVLDMVKMGSPSKDKDALKYSAKNLRGQIDANPVVRNAVKGKDHQFDELWQDTLHGRIPGGADDTENDLSRDETSSTNIKIGGGRFKRNNQSRENSMNRSQGLSNSSKLGKRQAPAQRKNSSTTGKQRVNRSRIQSQPQSPNEVDSRAISSPQPEPRRYQGPAKWQQQSLQQTEAQQPVTVQTLLVEIANREMQIETIRQRLVRDCPEFNSVDAFRFFDVQGKGQITGQQLERALNQIVQVSFEPIDIELFFKKFDREQRGALKYSEFCDAFVPKSQSVLSELTARQPRNVKKKIPYDSLFPQSTRDLFRQAWEILFKTEAEIEQYRQLLLKNPHFDIQQAYRLFDSVNGNQDVGKGFISREDLGAVLKLDAPHRDILFARFNKRLQAESLSYAEFIEEVTPRGPIW